APGGGARTQGVPFDFSGFDFSDFTEGAGRKTSFRDIFSNIFSGRGFGFDRNQPQPGSDLEYQVNVPFWQAIRGAVLRLNITRRDTCPNCGGRGEIQTQATCPECGGKGQVTQTSGRMKFNVQCPRCGGTGKAGTLCNVCGGEGAVSRTEPLEVRIKPGTRDGQRIRIPGKGNAGTMGAPPGDLYIIVRTGEHPVFRREGDDIHITVPVTPTEAALGAKIEVPTIEGRTLLRIPPGTQTGQKLRLREKGVPSAKAEGKRGDQIVEVKIVVPQVQDERSKEILRELARLNPEDPRAELWRQV
ncbi:MAG TPA: J domain-containing protein, partial [Terriglobales bacterium]|nr:J domain-containing protein [Terriglobales bacterium]